MKVVKRVFKISLIVLLTLVLVVAGYASYVVLTYNRIEDGKHLDLNGGGKSGSLSRYTEYTIVTQNFGFGAYTRDFSFFMDGGTESRAESRECVLKCLDAAYAEISSYDPDFVFLQEVDTDSDRSHHVNQRAAFDGKFSGYASSFAVNYHSAYLFYPIFKPHGKSNSGITTYSKWNISDAVRRSLPISTGFGKFLDLDRCYSVSRVPVANAKELVLYNVHTSAYGGSDEIRAAQMTMLFDDMKAEYEKGNFVVCGGDFNHDFTGSSTSDLNGGGEVEYGWAQPFPESLIPEGFSRATAYGDVLVPTCRNCDKPYEDGDFTIIVDGFITSANVIVESVVNVDAGFEYSDHNPVVMKFKLK